MQRDGDWWRPLDQAPLTFDAVAAQAFAERGLDWLGSFDRFSANPLDDLLRIGGHERHGSAIEVVGRRNVDDIQPREMSIVLDCKARRQFHARGAAGRGIHIDQQILESH